MAENLFWQDMNRHKRIFASFTRSGMKISGRFFVAIKPGVKKRLRAFSIVENADRTLPGSAARAKLILMKNGTLLCDGGRGNVCNGASYCKNSLLNPRNGAGEENCRLGVFRAGTEICSSAGNGRLLRGLEKNCICPERI